MTVLGNPGYTAHTLAEMDKLIFMLQILLPLAFLPFRRPIWTILCIPGFFFTVLSTRYGPLISITFQYSAHWIAFFFPGVAIGLEWMGKRAPTRAAAGIGPARGPGGHGVHGVARELPVGRRFSSRATPTAVPSSTSSASTPRASVATRPRSASCATCPGGPRSRAAGFTTPYVSNRPDAFNLTISGTTDAEYMFIPSEAADFIGDEKDIVTRVLRERGVRRGGHRAALRAGQAGTRDGAQRGAHATVVATSLPAGRP